MGPLAGLGGQATGLGAGTLGQYGQLMAPNLGIQQGLAGEIQGIQGGNLDVDPALVQQLGQQEQLFREQMRRQLGPDWETSSPGIEASNRFQQMAQTTKASANYNRLLGLIGAQQQGLGNISGTGINFGQFGGGIQGQQFGQGQNLGQMFGTNAQDLYNQTMGLRNQQLGGAGQMQGLTANQMAMFGQVPAGLANYGNQLGNYAQAGIGMTAPYQKDRFGQFQASQFPTSGQFTGQMLGKSGDRWMSMQGGGGGGGMSGPQGLSGGDYYANVGSGNPATFNPYGAQFQ